MKKYLLAVLTCSAAMHSAWAADPYLYVGLGLGATSSDVASENRSNLGYGDSADVDRGSGGAKIYAGWTSGRFGAELGLYDLGRYTVSGSIGGNYSKDRFDANAAAASFVANFPITQSMQIHGKLGAAYVTTKYHCSDYCNANLGDTEKSVVSPLLGVGFSWAFARNWAVRGDVEFMAGESQVGKTSGYTKSVGYSIVTAAIEARF